MLSQIETRFGVLLSQIELAKIQEIPEMGWEMRPSIEDAEHAIFVSELAGALNEVLDTLPPRQAYIVRQHYLMGFTLEQLSSDLDLSIARTQQLEHSGLRRMGTGTNGLKLRQYCDDDILSAGLKGNGPRAFFERGSRVEEIAIRMADGKPI